MRRHRIILTVLLVVSLITVAGAGDEPAGRRAGSSTLMTEVDAVLARQDAAVAELRSQLQDAATEAEALALLRRIDQCKRDAEVDVLRVQQRFALQAGDTDTAARIGQAIADFTRPVPAKPNPEAAKARREREAGGSGHE